MNGAAHNDVMHAAGGGGWVLVSMTRHDERCMRKDEKKVANMVKNSMVSFMHDLMCAEGGPIWIAYAPPSPHL